MSRDVYDPVEEQAIQLASIANTLEEMLRLWKLQTAVAVRSARAAMAKADMDTTEVDDLLEGLA